MTQHHRHQCLIYDGPASEQLPVIVPFLTRGLADGRRCLYLGDPETVVMIERALTQKGIDVESQKKRGALVFSSDRGRLADSGFEPRAMVSALRSKVDQALKDGFQGLSATGDMKWELGPEANFDRVLEYESLFERASQELPLHGLCRYHKKTVPPRALHDALISHRGVHLDAALTRENVFYRHSDEGEAEQRRLADELRALNKELESFNYSVSHDLRAPLRVIDGFSRLLMKEAAGGAAEKHAERIHASCLKMERIIDDLLLLSKISRQPIKREDVDLAETARTMIDGLKEADRERRTEFVAPAELKATGDPGLLGIALDNLLRNAWKFTGKTSGAKIELGSSRQNGATVYFVKDNGAGFDMRYVGKLFGPFQRLHAQSEFPGLGIGLATVQRVVSRHGGRVWAESEPHRGTAFYFTLEP